MLEDLASLYHSQGRHLEHFELLLIHGHVERALEASYKLTSTTDLPAETFSKILDYIWAGHFYAQHNDRVDRGSFNIPQFRSSDSAISRNSQWELANNIKFQKSCKDIYGPVLADIDDPTIRYFRSLREITNVDRIMCLTAYDEIPFDAFRQSVTILTKFLTRRRSKDWEAILLLAGVWQENGNSRQQIVLAWSPLHKESSSLVRAKFMDAVKEWVFQMTASAFLTLDTISKELLNVKWPRHHSNLSNRTIRARLGGYKASACHHDNKVISRTQCRLLIKDLLRLNKVFCSLAPLYYARTMPERFQARFLTIRRHWLEQLLHGLVYISSIDQDASVILHFQSSLFHEKPSSVTSALEQLLYIRLGEDWIEKNGFSWLLEQIQFASTHTRTFQIQFSRAILNRLSASGREGQMKQTLEGFDLLEVNAASLNHRAFHDNFKAFLSGFDGIPISEFSNMHAVAGTLESLAAYLILMTCPMAYIVPRSWVSLHMPSLIGHVERAEWLDGLDVQLYRECLVELVRSFSNLLFRVERAVQDEGFAFSYGGAPYPFNILQQRNVELLAMALLNTAEYQPWPTGFHQAWQSVRKACSRHCSIQTRHC